MRTVFNVVLAACAVVLVWMLYKSVMGPIEFDQAKAARDAKVIERLKEIRDAQQAYRNMHEGKYAGSFKELIDFVNNGKVPTILKVGTITDDQLEKGITEAKAIAMIEKAKKTNKWKDVEAAGLMGFRRDTSWVSVKDTLFKRAGFVADSLQYVPFTGGTAKFSLDTATQISKSGAPIYLFESKVPFDVYLKGLDEQQVINLIDQAEQTDKYPGLQVGSIESANNNAGNWE